MFDYIKGTIIVKNDTRVVLENNGVGYEFLCNKRTISNLPGEGEEAKIYTKLIHKEDQMFLCGFSQKEEKIIFDILTTVSGIGTKMALNLLDEFNIEELVSAVIREDYKLISKAKGVGAKLAQKIILELKDKLMNTGTAMSLVISEVSENKNISNDTILEVQTILESLGWNSNEYTNAIKAGAQLVKENNSEELLRETLKILSKE